MEERREEGGETSRWREDGISQVGVGGRIDDRTFGPTKVALGAAEDADES